MSVHHSDTSGSRRLTDPEIVQLHEQIANDRTDDRGNYQLTPLVILAVFSGLIFFAGTYLGFYVGNFAPTVYDERGSSMVAVAELKVDPVVMGRNLYRSNCLVCHQETGLGTPGLYPPLAKSEWVTGSEEVVARIVLHGLTGPITVAGQQFPGTAAMPAFGSQSNENLAAILTYIRQEWGNAAPAVTPEKVAEVRTKTGTRAAWTASELQGLQ